MGLGPFQNSPKNIKPSIKTKKYKAVYKDQSWLMGLIKKGKNIVKQNGTCLVEIFGVFLEL